MPLFLQGPRDSGIQRGSGISYVWFSGTGHEQLFNLDTDPEERHDLARDPVGADSVGSWRKALIGALCGREEEFADGERLIAGRPVRPLLSHLCPVGSAVISS